MTQPISRRRVAQGAAWAVPALAVAAQAPAIAASVPAPVLAASNTVTANENPDGSSNNGQIRVYSAIAPSVMPPNTVGACGPRVENATASTTVTGVSMTFWLPQSNYTFVNAGSPATSGWTTLSRDTSQAVHYDTSGNRIYAYSTTYTGPITVVGGVICLGTQNWISTNANLNTYPAPSYDAALIGVVDGAAQNDSGANIPVAS